MSKVLPAVFSCCLLAWLVPGCIDASQPCVEPQAGTTTGTSAGALKSCPNPAVPEDGLLDDFEDGNSQVLVALGRDGYWWTHHDPNGSTLEPEKFTPEEGGAGGSQKALHVHGSTSSAQGAYGSSVGVNFSNNGLYDASRYAGITFKAKVGPNSTHAVRVKVGDVNTHGQLGKCKDCWNHFGKDLQLTTEWKDYTILFADMTQVVGWGDPRPPSITPSQLASLDFSIGPGANFDLWVDDIQFVTCP